MGRVRDEKPEAPEADGPPAPAGDSAGVYYLSIEDFEARLPRPAPAEPQEAENP
jgi:hypothetical protein